MIRHRTVRRLAPLGVVALIGIGAAACGSSAGGSSNPGHSNASTTQPAKTAGNGGASF